MREYQDDLEDANNSHGAFEQLLGTVTANPNVREVTVVCHSMGCSPTLDSLRSKAIHVGKIGDKIKNVLLVAPDVDANAKAGEQQS